MRFTNNFFPTLKETPADAVIPSHQLMLRAGLIRPLGAGIFSWLPLGYRALKKVMDILRREMDAIGGQEFLLPALNPIEIWEQTGRAETMGDVIFHIKNRDGLMLAPTHEEIIAYHARQHIESYRDMPQIWYQIQNKFRNEPRPKSGVLRGRQFLMKDAYSLDTSWEGLDESYNKHYGAYQAIFNSCGIKFFVVGASTGAMGGKQSQEFMVESDAGEDICAISDGGYSANIEVAVSAIPNVGRIESNSEIEKFATPHSKTINELVEHFGLDVNRCAKSVVYIADDKPVLVLMRGNDELNENKFASVVGANNYRPATEDELIEFTGANGGSIGPINLKKADKIKIYADNLLKDANGLVSGANENGFHLKNIDLSRDCSNIEYADFRTVQPGEPCIISGEPLRVVKAIELGHIFKLGTKYSSALGAEFLAEDGKPYPIIMGSYGIGVERVLACYIEQNYDERGIIWSRPLAPYDVQLISLGSPKAPEVNECAEQVYKAMQDNGFEVLFDDRNERPGVKFNDADLMGMPIQVIIGQKNLANGEVEIKIRKSGERLMIPQSGVIEFLKSHFGN